MSERFVCPDVALYKQCIYFLFVVSCVTRVLHCMLSLRFVDD